ncbi:MAG: transcriptional regulator [Pseudomonadota bacterium]
MSDVALDNVIHAPNRLQICAFLMPLEEAEFRVLKEELGVSDSVLSKHISKLQDAGYVALRKSLLNSRQRTWARLTPSGREKLAAHLAALEQLVATARG